MMGEGAHGAELWRLEDGKKHYLCNSEKRIFQVMKKKSVTGHRVRHPTVPPIVPACFSSLVRDEALLDELPDEHELLHHHLCRSFVVCRQARPVRSSSQATTRDVMGRDVA